MSGERLKSSEEIARYLIKHMATHPESVAATLKEEYAGMKDDDAQRLALMFIGSLDDTLTATEQRERMRAYSAAIKAATGKSGKGTARGKK